MKSQPTSSVPSSAKEEVARQIEQSVAAKKCWACGCFHDALKTIDQALTKQARSMQLTEAMEAGKVKLVSRRYDCLGCEVCYPALAMNALTEAGVNLPVDACPSERPQHREGWPPLPGDYTVLRYHAPVAICTLTNSGLVETLSKSGEASVSIVGTLHTENLGIERLIMNIVSNPNIRFLILCGEDSRQAIGHLPGQSLLSLTSSGVDEQGRIIQAKGKRPILKNVRRDVIEHFRRNIQLVDLLGTTSVDEVLRQANSLAERKLGPAESLPAAEVVRPILGRLPERMVSDPVGYFVVYVDRDHQCLLLEHYENTGLLNVIIKGKSAAELYCSAIEKKLLSRLDHAAYLGRELARAETALRERASYTQDRAPEQEEHKPSVNCGCDGVCGEAA